MECNKEEAFRAKDLAERKMQNKDFIGARKIVLKAQQLYSDLENVSQMLTVCDVHCASDKKVAGNETDWYAILQVEQTADEAIIRKQYRKFALLLHPDKNKFPGAESAFKLIGEAQRVLVDKDKRHLHDMKRKSGAAYRPQQRPPPYSQNVGVQNNYRNNPTGVNFQPPGQSRDFNGRKTFWTACPYCSVKYEYFVAVMNKSLICQTCTRQFVAYERTAQGASTMPSFNQSAFPQRKDVPGQNFTKVELTRQGNSSAEKRKAEVLKRKVGKSELGSQKVNGKRQRKKEEESSESCDSDSSIEDDDFTAAVNSGSNGGRPRRSDRRRQSVSYNENNGSDDEDFPNHFKRAKDSRSSFSIDKEDISSITKEKEQNGGLAKDPKIAKGKGKADSSFKSPSDQEVYEYGEPDFNDFEEGRSKGCFSVGQVWALYDTLGAMPRFYARIRKVFPSAKFKVQMTWLEPNPDNQDELEWVRNGLPVSCGKFKDGVNETTEEHLMFSHNISWEKNSQNGGYKIFPKQGETWAIIKNWSLKWKSMKEPFEKFEYEFVEILSDYIEGVGVVVAYLGKLKGFVSVFCRTSKEGKGTIQIPHGELFRFSHMIPSFKLTDKESQGVPAGSFELDPASLPPHIEEVNSNEDIGKTKAESKVEIISDDENAPLESNPETFEIPEPQFFDFDAEKNIEKFEVGQIWALYGDEDGLPKYYAQITKVASPQEGFKVRLRWLASAGLPSTAIQWNDRQMLISCGKFEPRKGGQTYTSKDSFSHRLSADPTDKNHENAIMPKKGQIWGLYKNWTADMRLSDLKNCEYDVVEVLEGTGSRIKVLYLEQVSGFNSVFKAKAKEGSKEIPVSEILRFSHQIPAFKLTGEKNGSLRGFWELDPAALPIYFFAN